MQKGNVLIVNSFWPLLGALGRSYKQEGYTVHDLDLPAFLCRMTQREGDTPVDLVLVGDNGLRRKEVEEITSPKRKGEDPSLPIVLVGGGNLSCRASLFLSLGVDLILPAFEDVEPVLLKINPFLRMRRAYREIWKSNVKLRELSMTDDLTGLANRRFFMEDMKKGFEMSKRLEKPLSCVITDIDDFKKINDTFGHGGGDKILVEFSSLIRRAGRAYDIVARMGGDEFGWVLFDTDREMASRVARRAKRIVSQHPFVVDSHPIGVTASFGVATFCGDGLESYEELIERADRGLYLAKERGKGLVVSWVIGGRKRDKENIHLS